MKATIILLIVIFYTLSISAQNKYITVSSSGRENEAGIFVYKWTGDHLELVEKSTLVKSTSYHTIHPKRPLLYAVGSNKVYAFSLDEQSGHLTLLNEKNSGGNGPSYVSVDQSGRWILVANYSGATAAVLPINEDGTLGDATSIQPHAGSSIDTSRQQSSHPHLIMASPDNKYVLVPDLGIDQIVIYQFDPIHGILTKSGSGKTFRGAGPRHLDFHPDASFVYVLNELSSSVGAYHWDPDQGKMDMIATYPSLPSDFDERNTSADIHITKNGQFLFASNRGHDSISTFKINLDGSLSFHDRFSSGGKTPRNFFITPDDQYVFVANQASGNVVQFALDDKTGKVQVMQTYSDIPRAQCIKMW